MVTEAERRKLDQFFAGKHIVVNGPYGYFFGGRVKTVGTEGVEFYDIYPTYAVDDFIQWLREGNVRIVHPPEWEQTPVTYEQAIQGTAA